MVKLACFPCEVQHREFDSKLMLASRIVSSSRQNIALIGYDKYFSKIINDASSCFLLDKSISSIIFNGRIKPCKCKDGIVYINDEEGVNDLDETPELLDLRADKCSVDYIDKYLAWGEDDAKFYSDRKKNLGDKVVITGSHRYDLLNDIGRKFYEEDICSIKNLFGPFVLFNDNLAVDHFDSNYSPPTHLFNADSDSKNRASNEWNQIVSQHRVRRDLIAKYLLGLVNVGFKLIVRPHPAHDSLFWHQKFRLEPKVLTIYQGPVEPWLHASSCVITSGCTTGLQALLANVPSFEIPISPIPKAFSTSILPKCNSWADLTEEKLSQYSSTFADVKEKCARRWKTSLSTCLEMSDLIQDQILALPHQKTLNWVDNICRMTPQPPKWRDITTRVVYKKFNKLKSLLQLCDSIRIKKVSNALYIIYHN